jgi:hypothetical protein
LASVQPVVDRLFFEDDRHRLRLVREHASIGKGIYPGSGATAETVSGVGDEAYWLQGQRIVQSYNPHAPSLRDTPLTHGNHIPPRGV